MTAAQDVSWINKPKHVFIQTSPAQGDLPVRSNRIIVDLKLAYIAEMELLPVLGPEVWSAGIDVEDAYNAGIVERVR